MRRLPIGATVVVALAVATMVALGIWQLHRLDEKRALLATYAMFLSGVLILAWAA